MRQLNIRVQAENLDASHELAELFESNLENFLRSYPKYRHYQLHLIPQEPSQFHHDSRSTTSPYYPQQPAFNLNLSYSFANNSPSHELSDLNNLEEFAQSYEQFVRHCLGSSADYMDRVSESGLRAIRHHQSELNRFIKREKDKWSNQQYQNPHSTYGYPRRAVLFRPQYDDYHQRKARAEFGTAIALSLLSIPIFFIEPITASFLLLAAALFLAAGLLEKAQANQSEVTIII